MNTNILTLYKEFEDARKYWEEKLGGEITQLKLPFDYPKNNNYTYGTHEMVLGEELSKKLLSLGKNQDLLLFIIMLTGLKILLNKYTGQEDILVAAPTYKDENIQKINKYVIFRDILKDKMSFKELLVNVKQTVSQGYKNQHYPVEKLIEQIEENNGDILVLNTALMMEGIHCKGANEDIAKSFTNNLSLLVSVEGNYINIRTVYNASLLKEESIRTFVERYEYVLSQAVEDLNKKLTDFTITTETDKEKIIHEFNNTTGDYPYNKTIHQLFEEQVQKTPEKTAIVYRNREVTYSSLNKEANKLANYLIATQDIKPDTLIGLFMENSIDQITAILGILKAGGAYVPISTGLPEERIKTIINDSQIKFMVSTKKNIKMLNKLQWECKTLETFLCMDSEDIYSEPESQESGLMDKKLWEYIGENAVDEITGGGWASSYTGEDLSKEEMSEYADNVFEKLKPFLNPEARVLEIGCASGISMFKIAPQVGMYYGTDLSGVIIEKDRERAVKEGFNNIKLECLPAHEIDRVSENEFDIVIINSVIQAFSGHNYLRQVIKKALRLMKDKGVLFIGDIMDQDKKYELLESLLEFKRQNPGYDTKTDVSEELFVSRAFYEDLSIEMKEIQKVEFSTKIHTIENELTRFRYDAVISIDKSCSQKETKYQKNRYQYDLSVLQNFSEETPACSVTQNDLAYIIYTSGTTGKPKGVMLEHRGVANLKGIFDNTLGLNEKDRTIHFASISFDASVWDIFTGLLTGATLYIMPEEVIGNYERFEGFINENEITFATLPPTYLVNLNPDRITSLKKLITAGSAASTELLSKWKERVEYRNGYGPTESTVCATLWKYEKDYCVDNSVPIGKPASNIRVYIVDNNNNLQPVGVVGELCIAGVSLARGYLNNKELTDEKFVESPFLPGERMYKSGDLARWLPDGNIEFLGRKDQQVKIRGFRIETGEIEAQLLKHGLIQEVAVIPRGDEDKYLCAYFTAPEKLAVSEVKEFLARRLPDYMIPLYFVQLDSMPLTSNSKINVKALPDPDGRQSLGVKYVEPRNEMEKELTAIWSEILGIEKIGIDDDFFQLGGHSLKATALVTNIHRAFNTEIQLKEVFDTPTIRGLAAKINSSAQSIYSSIKPIERTQNCPSGFYPVSSAQKRLFIINQYEGIGTGYNMPAAVGIEGILDIERLKQSFKKLIKRHESLRTYFCIYEDEIMQVVQEEVDFDIGFIDISEKPETTPDIKSFIRPFELDKAPLLRATLVKTAEDRHLLIIDMHHIISDGMSMNVIIEEFAQIYEGQSLPELKIQYKDYAAWQNDLFKSDSIKKQEDYWKKVFKGDIPVLDMPYDYTRPLIQNFEGDRINFSVDPGTAKKLKELASKTETTLYMVMLAAYNILLSKYAGQEDIVVGSPVAGRHHSDLQSIVGFFVNTVALRNSVGDDKSFIDFLSQVKGNTLEAFENQDYQFEQLVDILALPRDMSRNPLFDTMFVMQNIGNTEISINGLKFSSVDIDFSTAKFDLKMEAMEWEDEIKMGLEYKTKLFKRETMERLAEHYTNILLAITDSPGLEISQISLLSQNEEKQLVCEFNQSLTESKQPDTFKQQFEKKVQEAPGSIALVSEDIRLSYGELNTKANSLARKLRAKGIKPDEIVGILCEQSCHMIISILAVIKAGGAYMPLNPELPQDRIEYMLEDSRAQVLISHGELVNKVNFKGAIVNLDCENTYDTDTSNLTEISEPDDLIYVIYTSGTTGKPKGVMIENHSLVNYSDWFIKKFNIRKKDKTAIVSSLCFDLAYTALYSALLSGSEIHLLTKEEYSDPDILLPYIEINEINYIKMTPSLFNMMVNSDYFNKTNSCKQLGLIVLGGEEINLKDLEAYNKKYPEATLVNHYGPTETTIGAIAKVIDFAQFESYKKHPVIGKPIQNAGVYILDKNMKPVPVGIKGELYIAGEGVARGYLNRPDLSSEKFIENPFTINGTRIYKTGDIGRYVPDGSIEFLGRRDNQIKIRGYRVELGEIEAQLLKIATVKDAFVTVKEDENKDKNIVAYVVCEGELNERSLREYLSEYLPGYMIPTCFIKLEKIPLTLNGKVDKNALPDVEIVSARDYEEPSGEIEIKLAKIWSEILNVERIGANDNFFELGGHSLKATMLVNKIHKELNSAIPLKEVFTMKNLRSMAEYIESSKSNSFSSIQPIEHNSYYELSSAQRRMFILNTFEETGIAYNLPGVIEISGKVDKLRFEEAFKKLVERHESLRTSFRIVNEQPVQEIHQQADLRIKYIETQQNRLPNVIKEFIRPFDLSKAPLLRVALVSIADEQSEGNDRYILLYDMHHIISDGVSRRIMVNEFISLYEGKQLEPLRLQYKDFAAWQNKLFRSGEIEKQEKYWKERFEGNIPVLNMPTDFKRPDIKNFAGSNISFKVEKDLAVQLNKLTAKTGSTLYMVLISAYKVLLSRYSGQQDLVVGSPIAGRPHADIENIIGMFVNMIAIRSFPSPNKSFNEFLNEVKDSCLKAYDNQEYQYEELVDKLGSKRDMSRNPLFDVSFTLQNLDIETNTQSLKFKPYDFENSVSKFDLTLWCAQEKDCIEFVFEYCTGLFKQETIERLKKDYVKILESIVENPDIKIKEIELEDKYLKREKVLTDEIHFNF